MSLSTLIFNWLTYHRPFHTFRLNKRDSKLISSLLRTTGLVPTQITIYVNVNKNLHWQKSSIPWGQSQILHREWERYFKTMDFRALNCKKSHILAKLFKRYLNLKIQGCWIRYAIGKAMKVLEAVCSVGKIK